MFPSQLCIWPSSRKITEHADINILTFLITKAFIELISFDNVIHKGRGAEGDNLKKRGGANRGTNQ